MFIFYSCSLSKILLFCSLSLLIGPLVLGTWMSKQSEYCHFASKKFTRVPAHLSWCARCRPYIFYFNTRYSAQCSINPPWLHNCLIRRVFNAACNVVLAVCVQFAVRGDRTDLLVSRFSGPFWDISLARSETRLLSSQLSARIRTTHRLIEGVTSLMLEKGGFMSCHTDSNLIASEEKLSFQHQRILARKRADPPELYFNRADRPSFMV